MKYAVIGAGIAGLSAINKIQELKLASSITLFEQNEKVGGRLGAKFDGPYQFDSSVQHIRITKQEFSHFLNPIFNKGFLKPWYANFCVIEAGKTRNSRKWSKKLSNMHYVAIPSMNKVSEELIKILLKYGNLETKLNNKVKKIKQKNNKLEIISDDGKNYDDFDFVISTVTPEFNLKILPKEFSYRENLKKKKMMGCYALLIAFDKMPDISWDAALIKNSKLSWISCDSSKPGRKLFKDKKGNKHICFIADSRNSWADDNINRPIKEVREELTTEILGILRMNESNIVHCDLIRWPHANIEKQSGAKSFFDKKLNIALCGDYFIQGRVEAAFLSAMDAVNKISKKI